MKQARVGPGTLVLRALSLKQTRVGPVLKTVVGLVCYSTGVLVRVLVSECPDHWGAWMDPSFVGLVSHSVLTTGVP